MQLFDEEFRKEFPALLRWYLTLAHDSHFTAVWGKVQLCEQALKFSRPPLTPPPLPPPPAPISAPPCGPRFPSMLLLQLLVSAVVRSPPAAGGS